MQKELHELEAGKQYFIVIKDQDIDQEYVARINGTFVRIEGTAAVFTVNGAEQSFEDAEKDFYEEIGASSSSSVTTNKWNQSGPVGNAKPNTNTSYSKGGRRKINTRKQRDLRKQKKDRKTRQHKQRRQRSTRSR